MDDDDLEPYLSMTKEDFAEAILMLLLEELAEKKLARFRIKNLNPEPI